MVWSLSQDDDGLESVSPNAARPPAPSAPGIGAPSPGTTPPGTPAKRTHEPTLVLAERRLDRLRAEVKRRQRLFFLRRQGAILGWMLAGGAAVAVGVLGARSLRSAETPMPESGSPALGAAAVPPAPAGEASAPSVVPEAAPAEVAAAAEDSTAQPAGPEAESISLDEIPTRSAVEKPRRVVARPKR